MLRGWQLSLFLLIALLPPGCRNRIEPAGPAPETDPGWFADVTAKVGLDFIHDAGPMGNYFLPQIIGSGGAVFDFDGDGRMDLYLLNNGGPKGRPNQLYRQRPDGSFQNVSRGSGLDFAGHCMGVAVGDVNNDGRPDVLVTLYGGVRLFLNNGDGTFTDVTPQAGLDNPAWGTSAAFFDYDRDGRLDLAIANYVDYEPSRRCPTPSGTEDYCHPTMFRGTVARLFRNATRPDAGIRFEDVTAASGLARLPGPGLGVVCADFDGDGWPDIFIANDAQANRLWINQRDGTFEEEALRRGLAFNGLGKAQGNMGIALGDTDGDGLFDVFVTHLTQETNTLWCQGPRGHFWDRTPASGLTRSAWRGTGFGTVLADFDLDGELDLALVNGRVSRAGSPSPAFWPAYAERNQLFAGLGQPGRGGSGNFDDVSERNWGFCGLANVGRGLLVGDLDNDGAVDLIVTRVAAPARIYRNVATRKGHWLLIRLLDARGQRDAYGAEISIQAGKRRWRGWVNPGTSYLGSNDPRVHFGLGDTGRIEQIHVTWPDGAGETFPGGGVDRTIDLRKGTGVKE